MLMNDMARCMGMTQTFCGMPVFCPWRQKCARFVDQDTGGPNTVKFAYLCEEGNDSYIPTEKPRDK